MIPRVDDPLATEPAITTLIGQVATDARDLARAEIALVRARVGDVTARYKGAAIFFAVAGVLSLAALIALLVGLILSLAPLIGPALATAAVVGTTLQSAAVLGMVGKARLKPGGPRS